jgi:hypothetical protein
MGVMKAGATFFMNNISLTQFETRRRQVADQRELIDTRAAARPVEKPRRVFRLLKAVRGAAAA